MEIFVNFGRTTPFILIASAHAAALDAEMAGQPLFAHRDDGNERHACSTDKPALCATVAGWE